MARRVVACLGVVAVVGTVVGAAPGPAWARRGVIVRAASPAPVGEAPARQALVPALARGDADLVVDPRAVAQAALDAGAVPRERLAAFARARDLAAEGWRAYLAADVAFAEAQLVNARRTLEDVLDLDGALGLVADVSLRLGAVRLKGGRAGEAQAAFALARALDPDRELLAQDFAPAVITAFEQAGGGGGGGGAAAPTGTLEIVAPAEARVAVDGREVGVGGGVISTSVAVGEHVVVVRAPGRLAVGQIVAVPGAGARLEVSLDADPAAVALADDGAFAVGAKERRVLAAATAVVTWAELDELWLVVVTWRGGEPTLLGQRCAGAPLRCSAVREVRVPSVARLGAAAVMLVDGLVAPPADARLGPIVFEDTRATRPEPPRTGGGRPGGGGRSWWESPWLWVGAGVVLVAAGGAAVWLADDELPSFETRVPPLP